MFLRSLQFSVIHIIVLTIITQPADNITMLEIEVLKGEFDENRQVLHVSAERPAHIQNAHQLNKVCDDVCEMLEKYTSDGRCYLLVDMSTLVIEPELVDEYGRKVKKIAKQYLLPNGLLRYGFQITRVTATLAHQKQQIDDPLFFRSKDEALDYIDNLSKRQSAKIL